MVTIFEHVDLTDHNSFHVPATARYFVQINKPDDFHQLTQQPIFEQYRDKLLFLGGGSNILLTQDLDALVIYNNIQTMRLVTQDTDSITLSVGAGYNRHKLVMFCAQRNRRGLENLALIPGTIGAAPVQNIGAYGVEAKDTIINVKGFDLTTDSLRALNTLECDFGYRDSVFKHEYKNKFFITHVTFQLSKKPIPILTYPSLAKAINNRHSGQDEIDDPKQSTPLTPLDIANTVITIRQSKLPDPDRIGTAGSFFQNPIIPQTDYDQLLNQFPTLKARPVSQSNGSSDSSDNLLKISAAQLIELSGIPKGFSLGNAATYDKHALVLINPGQATGTEIERLANHIIMTVQEKTGITLTPEVTII